ncbi:MAG TPA: hypothetical protein VEH06_14975 [Candidatus Bathyarchaeia archaeon]|nr:hypothetical protein [Candidatus Bathyarchaeia archaeon]
MNHKALAIAPIVVIAALVLTAVEFAISQQAFAWGHRVVVHSYPVPYPYPVPVPVFFPDNRVLISQQINQDNNCTKATCANDAENEANTFGSVR